MVDGGERLVMTYGGDLVEISQEWFLTQLFATALPALLKRSWLYSTASFTYSARIFVIPN
jgi:hypothetical protein